MRCAKLVTGTTITASIVVVMFCYQMFSYTLKTIAATHQVVASDYITLLLIAWVILVQLMVVGALIKVISSARKHLKINQV